jgi:hypothetical protein
MSDVSDIVALLKSLTDAIDVVEKIMADGKVSVGDLRYFPALLGALKPGFDGMKKIPDEFKDMEKESLQEVAQASVDLVLKIIEKFALVAEDVSSPAAAPVDVADASVDESASKA